MFTKHEKGRLRRLERRADWLEARCAIAQSRGQYRDLDEAELSALRWAVEQLREWELLRPEPSFTAKTKRQEIKAASSASGSAGALANEVAGTDCTNGRGGLEIRAIPDTVNHADQTHARPPAGDANETPPPARGGGSRE
jgi:hypothetical protein